MKNIRTISIVGAGGKTSLLYSLAHDLQQKQKKILITTTTKIYTPVTNSNSCIVTPSSFSFHQNPWSGHSILVAGEVSINDSGKLNSPPASLLQLLAKDADYILCEADGSKHYPVKYPAEWEPVLLPCTDLGIVVMGLSALGKPLYKICHRSSLAAAHLKINERNFLTKEDLLSLSIVYLKELQLHSLPFISFLFNQYQKDLHEETFYYLKENLMKKGAADVDFSYLAAPDIL